MSIHRFHGDEADQGFWGRIAGRADPTVAWDIVLPTVSTATGRPETEVIGFLESIRGYIFADEILAILEKSATPLEQAIQQAAAKLPQLIAGKWGGTLAPAEKGDDMCSTRGGHGISIVRYTDHPVFGRLFWFYSSMHLSFAGGGGMSSDSFALEREVGRATGFSAGSSIGNSFYGEGQHMSFLDHLQRIGRKGIPFGSDAEKDELLAWMKTADWRDLPLPSSQAFRSITYVEVLITGNANSGFAVHIPGFPSCGGRGATEDEALQAAEGALGDHLVAILFAGTRMPSLHGHKKPTLDGAREGHLLIKTPLPRRNPQPIAERLRNLDNMLTAKELWQLETDVMLTGTKLSEALHARGCAAYAGRGNTQADDATAAKWFRLAAEHGHAQARLILGCLYRDGLGVPKQGAEAISLLQRIDHPLAFYVLGLIYADGDGVPRDDALAGEWLRKAATAGLPDATTRLLQLLESGRVAPTEPDEPLHWLQLAAARGDRAAHDRVFPITKRLMDSLFRLAMAAPPLPSPMSEWRIVRLEDARPPETPAKQFAGFIAVLYRTQYLQPDETEGYAQVWVYDLLEREPGQIAFNFTEIGRRKPLL